MYVTAEQLKARVAAFLKQDVSQLFDYWDEIIAGAAQSAYDDVTGALLLRGYTIPQIDAWDRRAEFSYDMGLFWALVRGVGAHDYDDKFINKLDRRKELKEVPIHNAQVHADPARDDATGIITSGFLDDDEDVYTRATKW